MIRVKTGARPNVPVVIEKDETGEPKIWIEFRPWSTLGHGAGQRSALSTLAAGEDVGTSMVGYTIALARWGAVAWGGFLDDETGELLELTPDNVQAALEQSRDVFLAVDRDYATPALAADAEKNGSALPPDGTSPASRLGKRAGAQGSAGATTAAPAKRRAKPAPTSKPSRRPKAAS